MKMSEGRPIPVDQDARVRAVTDLDSTLCIEAGAGTGKTTILVDRYISLIKTGRASCSQIVEITFTEKAAGEMNLRLREEIEKLIHSSGAGSLEISRFRAAKESLESAPVSTPCGRLIYFSMLYRVPPADPLARWHQSCQAVPAHPVP